MTVAVAVSLIGVFVGAYELSTNVWVSLGAVCAVYALMPYRRLDR